MYALSNGKETSRKALGPFKVHAKILYKKDKTIRVPIYGSEQLETAFSDFVGTPYQEIKPGSFTLLEQSGIVTMVGIIEETRARLATANLAGITYTRVNPSAYSSLRTCFYTSVGELSIAVNKAYPAFDPSWSMGIFLNRLLMSTIHINTVLHLTKGLLAPLFFNVEVENLGKNVRFAMEGEDSIFTKETISLFELLVQDPATIVQLALSSLDLQGTGEGIVDRSKGVAKRIVDRLTSGSTSSKASGSSSQARDSAGAAE